MKSQNEIFVDLLDYGKSVTVQKSALCSLPAEFRSLPAQVNLMFFIGFGLYIYIYVYI